MRFSARLGVLLAAVSAGAALAAAVYIGRGIIRSVGHVAAAARALAVGEIEQEIEVHSHDEIGEMALAFRTMVAYQREIAEIATAVARGDLSKSVEPKSPSDRLGNALHDMVDGLRAMVGQVHSSARALALASEQLGAASTQTGTAVQQAVVEENSAATEEMAAQATEVGRSAESIAAAFEENGAITEEVAASAQEMAAQVEEMTAQAEELASTADELKGVVSRFRLADDETPTVPTVLLEAEAIVNAQPGPAVVIPIAYAKKEASGHSNGRTLAGTKPRN